jgi:SAM-dependent methyltransferase
VSITTASNLLAEATAPCLACGAAVPQRFRFRKNSCDIFACPECGLGRAVTAGFDPASYYTDAYFAGGHEDGYANYASAEAVLRKEFRGTVEYLSRFVAAGSLLEIGCAYGFFLLEAQRRFDVWGIEVVQNAVDFCRDRGLTNVRCGLLDEAILRDLPSMDAIVLLDVIEHLPDPDAAFRLLTAKLAPGGVMLLTTGDWSSVLARLAGVRWRLMTPPQHLSYFTPDSLQRLGKRHRLRMESIDHPWKTVPLSLIVHQLQRMLGMHHAVVQPPSFGGTGIPLNLFDAVRVVYRKT